MVIYLGHRLPGASSDQPGNGAGHSMVPLFGLAPGGVYLASRSPGCWCALTAPLHPYPQQKSEAGSRKSEHFHDPTSDLRHPTSVQAVSISVALALGSPPLGVTQHPALWSPDFPPVAPAGRDRRSGTLLQIPSKISNKWQGVQGTEMFFGCRSGEGGAWLWLNLQDRGLPQAARSCWKV